MRSGRRHLVGWGRDRRAVAAVEFALIAPIMLALIGAAVDLGRGIEQAIKLETAARAAAQYVEASGLILSGGTFEDVPQLTINLMVGSTALAGLSGARITATNSVCYCPNNDANGSLPTTTVGCNTNCNTGMARVRTITASADFAPIFPTSRYIPFNQLGTINRNVVVRM